MASPDDHYRYESTYRDPGRPATGVKATINAGHRGTVLNCPHPACVKVRQEQR